MRKGINWVIDIKAADWSYLLCVSGQLTFKYMFTKVQSARPAMRRGNGTNGQIRKGSEQGQGPHAYQSHTA